MYKILLLLLTSLVITLVNSMTAENNVEQQRQQQLADKIHLRMENQDKTKLACFDTTLPNGNYENSCSDCCVRHSLGTSTLWCHCLKNSGTLNPHYTTIDIDNCEPGSIVNNNGVLSCNFITS
jgi:hypothetical protein